MTVSPSAFWQAYSFLGPCGATASAGWTSPSSMNEAVILRNWRKSGRMLGMCLTLKFHLPLTSALTYCLRSARRLKPDWRHAVYVHA